MRWSQAHPCLPGYFNDWRRRAAGVAQQYVNFSVAQLTDELGVNLPNGLRFVGDWRCQFDQQVDVTTLEAIVDPRAKQRDLRTLTQHRVHGALDGVDLAGGQAHGGDGCQ